MGNEMSEERKREIGEDFLENWCNKSIKDGPDLRVNKSIIMFTSLASSDNLRQHYEKRKMENHAADRMEGHAADWTKSLVEKLSGMAPCPNLAGLGALAIAVFIDILSSTSNEESTKDALRCVFAEEKASEVWDQIDECLKRCRMHISDASEQRNDIKRIERQLSAALTKLKNSMLRDGHMSSEALKAWVNGAAFHIQMLIHLVRLGGIQSCDPVETLLSDYLDPLDTLFQKHKEMIKGKCKRRGEAMGQGITEYYLVGEDSTNWHIGSNSPHKYYICLEAYYNHRFGRQKSDIQQYFRDVSQNLQELVRQIGSFDVN
ncbi:uncharacterized protein LOC134091253 [Sardina pilchardus]|uniref:uncharacterized protein LOC134091253 n=1 Tax=Sardina pilchardus TaxID=27697 RepID=UPI002E0D6C3E